MVHLGVGRFLMSEVPLYMQWGGGGRRGVSHPRNLARLVVKSKENRDYSHPPGKKMDILQTTKEFFSLQASCFRAIPPSLTKDIKCAGCPPRVACFHKTKGAHSPSSIDTSHPLRTPRCKGAARCLLAVARDTDASGWGTLTHTHIALAREFLDFTTSMTACHAPLRVCSIPGVCYNSRVVPASFAGGAPLAEAKSVCLPRVACPSRDMISMACGYFLYSAYTSWPSLPAKRMY